jgi:hypothetical protein
MFHTPYETARYLTYVPSSLQLGLDFPFLRPFERSWQRWNGWVLAQRDYQLSILIKIDASIGLNITQVFDTGETGGIMYETIELMVK